MFKNQSLDQIRHLVSQAKQYHDIGEHHNALHCYQKAIEFATPLRDNALMGYILVHAGSEHRDCNNYYHAVELILAGLMLLPESDDFVPLRAFVKKILAITFLDIYGPQKPEVVQLLQESLDEFARIGDTNSEANVLLHLGSCYIRLNFLEKADNILQLALDKAQKCGDIQLQSWILSDLAELEIERNQWGLALEYARNAREKLSTLDGLEGEGDTWITEARVLFRMGHFDRSLSASEAAYSLYADKGNSEREIRSQRHIAKALVALNQLDEACKVLYNAKKTSARLELQRYKILINLDIAEIALGRGNLDLAQEIYIEAEDLATRQGIDDLRDYSSEMINRLKGSTLET